MLQTIAITVGIAVGLLTFAIRTWLDAQAVWWERARWAMDHAQSGDEGAAVLGVREMVVLSQRRGVSRADKVILYTALEDATLRLEEASP